MEIEYALNALSSRKIALINPEKWDDRNDVYFLDMFKERSNKTGLYAACFTTSPERNHHWRSFSPKDHSVCLVFSRSRLTNYLTREYPNLIKGHVSYLSIPDLKRLGKIEWDTLPFLKRYGFIDEEEYRVVLANEQPQGRLEEIALPTEALRKVVLCPNIPNYIERAVRSEIQQMKLPPHIKMERSTLPDDQSWKVVGLTLTF